MRLAGATGFSLFRLNVWGASILAHAGAGMFFIANTFSPGPAEADNPVIVERVPVMSIPKPVREPEPEPEIEKAEPRPEPETEFAEEKAPEPETKEIKQEVSTVLSPPTFEGNTPPKYPRLARRLRYEGTVILLVTVSPLGECSNIEVKQSSGYSMLDKAALKAVARWNFKPAKVGETAVEAKIEVPIRFVLTS